MDRSQAIGFVVLAVFILIYFWFFAPKPEEQLPGNNQQPQQTEAPVQKSSPEVDKDTVNEKQAASEETSEEPALNDSAKTAQIQTKYGVFANSVDGEEETYTLENDKVKIEFSNKGGKVKSVALKGFEDYNYEPLVLLDDESNELNLIINTQGGEVKLNELYFQKTDDFEQKADTSGISFVVNLSNGKQIKHTYYLPLKSYELVQKSDYDALMGIVTDNTVKLSWDYDMKRLERDLGYSQRYSTINYYDAFDEFDKLSARSDEKEEFTFTKPMKWFSFKQRFFTTGLIANTQFDNGKISMSTDPIDSSIVKNAHAETDLPLTYFSGSDNSFTYYFGPNDLKELKKVGHGFRENLYLGFPVVNLINKYLIITVFNFLQRFISNYGIIIIILVLIVRLIISPLTYKSHIQMAKTKVLKPQIDELKKKYGDEMQKFQKEQMKLYQQVGVNPLSGCIPMVLQMPILLAMFQFIPNAIQLRHESFLWSNDLSIYDSVAKLPFDIPFYGDHVSLFTLLMTFSTILITRVNSQMTTAEGPMKIMQYMMPLVIMFALNSYPAGLTFYYFVSNIVSFGQMTLIKRFVDENKIMQILEQNKKRNANKKKSKFQLRLEEAMKAGEDTKKKKSSKK